jgi:hypothetical protein
MEHIDKNNCYLCEHSVVLHTGETSCYEDNSIIEADGEFTDRWNWCKGEKFEELEDWK